MKKGWFRSVVFGIIFLCFGGLAIAEVSSCVVDEPDITYADGFRGLDEFSADEVALLDDLVSKPISESRIPAWVSSLGLFLLIKYAVAKKSLGLKYNTAKEVFGEAYSDVTKRVNFFNKAK